MSGDHFSWLPLKLAILILAVFLAACSTQGAESVNSPEAPTGIPDGWTPTPLHPETPTPSVPAIEIGGLQIPDPHVSNPELFDAANPESPIVQFANAFGANPEDVAFGAPELKTAADGTQFVVLTTSDLTSTANYDETGIPLLVAEQGENGKWKWSKATLRSFADKINLNLGVQIPSTDQKTLDLIKTQFNEIVIWIAMDYSQSEQDKLDFTSLDYYGRFALNNDLRITAMPLVWQETVPDWIQNGGFNKGQLTQIMIDHIMRLVSSYKSVDSWIVVNEPYTPPYITHDIFYETIGPEYLDIAFQAAKEANPSAELIFNNDLNYTSNGIMTPNTMEIVEGLKSKGLIDFVGVEMHIDGSKEVNSDDVIQTLKSYAVPVVITELDVNLSSVAGNEQDRLFRQALIYQKIIKACLQSGVCSDIRIWGVDDKNSVWEAFTGQPNADPLLFSDDLSPKPAYYAVLQALLQ